MDEFDDEEWDQDDGEIDLEPSLDDCGMGEDGFCSLAGTEHCDFECPFRDC